MTGRNPLGESLLEIIVEPLTEINEELFRYFDLTEGYEITINFIKNGSQVPLHRHDQTVYNYVMDGEFEVTDSAGTKTYKKGDWIRIPKGRDHSVVAKAATTLLELWQKR